jgi:hypothetical protein
VHAEAASLCRFARRGLETDGRAIDRTMPQFIRLIAAVSLVAARTRFVKFAIHCDSLYVGPESEAAGTRRPGLAEPPVHAFSKPHDFLRRHLIVAQQFDERPRSA